MQIGNAWIDDETTLKGLFDHWWTHALNSDATHDAIVKYCNFANLSSNNMCVDATYKAWDEIGNTDTYNIYAPICLNPDHRNSSGTSPVSLLFT